MLHRTYFDSVVHVYSGLGVQAILLNFINLVTIAFHNHR